MPNPKTETYELFGSIILSDLNIDTQVEFILKCSDLKHYKDMVNQELSQYFPSKKNDTHFYYEGSKYDILNHVFHVVKRVEESSLP